jgi:hypothetical protein
MRHLAHPSGHEPSGTAGLSQSRRPAAGRPPHVGVPSPDASYGRKSPIYLLYSVAGYSIFLVTHPAHRSLFTEVTCSKAGYFFAPLRLRREASV